MLLFSRVKDTGCRHSSRCCNNGLRLISGAHDSVDPVTGVLGHLEGVSMQCRSTRAKKFISRLSKDISDYAKQSVHQLKLKT